MLGNSDLQCQIFSTSVNSQGRWNKAERSYIEKQAAKKVNSIPPRRRGAHFAGMKEDQPPQALTLSRSRGQVSMPTSPSCYHWTIRFHSPLFRSSAAAPGLLKASRGTGPLPFRRHAGRHSHLTACLIIPPILPKRSALTSSWLIRE